jgi:Mor family transcriptional regulator
MTDPARQRYPDVLEDLAAIVAAALVDAGIAHATAHAAARKSVERVRAEFGGQNVYIPQGLGYILARRNAEIRRRLAAGESRDEIRRDFDLSNMQLRRIEDDDTPSRR